MNKRIKISLVIYILCVILVLHLNPEWTHDNGVLREFGTGEEKTILPLWMILFLLAVLSYYLSQVMVFISLAK